MLKVVSFYRVTKIFYVRTLKYFSIAEDYFNIYFGKIIWRRMKVTVSIEELEPAGLFLSAGVGSIRILSFDHLLHRTRA